jgi:methionyl-tRNA synthetase
MQPYYVTTPIYYVNDKPHIGHCYTTALADVAARFARLMGRDVYFLTGTDEHADKVIAAAAKHGMTEQQWTDACSAEFVRQFGVMNFQYDVFYRTSSAQHKTKAAAYIQTLVDKGDIYLGDYVGWYDASQDEYLTETVAKEHEYKSPVTKMPLEKRTEKNYFFRLSRYQDALQKHIDTQDGFILPSARRNEILGRLREGLVDVPVSRQLKAGESTWGVLMPNDPGHRVYIWIEALCNYLTAVDTAERRAWWDSGTVVHLMAKDIVWFHAVIWPAMLMALGERLPRTVYAHAYWVSEGRKMSKSLGNFIDLERLNAYVRTFGVDALRWYLVTQGPQDSTDADFAHGRFVETYNAELANGIGNASSRVGNMIDKYFGGKVPDAKGVTVLEGLGEYDWPSITSTAVRSAISKAEVLDLAGASFEGINLVRKVDAYINATEPFKLAKKIEAEPGLRDRLAAVLYHCAEALRVASVLLSPAMPGKMGQLQQTWNCVPGKGVSLGALCDWHGAHALKPGAGLTKGEVLFMRADPAAALLQ